MGKASRNKRESARERIAAQRAAQHRAEMRTRMLWTGGSILGVVVIVVAFIVFKATQSPASTSSSPTSATGTALPASVIRDVTTVPAATLASVGTGTADTKSVTVVSSAKALTSGGKPEVLYIGAQYCPYCAAERWAMAAALSRFGTFHGLSGIHSAGGQEVYPHTAHAQLLQVQLHQQVPDLHPGRAGDGRREAAGEDDRGAERADHQVRQPAVRLGQ